MASWYWALYFAHNSIAWITISSPSGPSRRTAVSAVRIIKNGVGADPQPHDVRLAGQNLLAVAEGRPSIRCPGHLPYVLGALDSLDAQARGELRRLRAQTGDQLVAGGEEGAPLLAAQFAVSRSKCAERS